MQSSACKTNDSRNICHHRKCNHFIYIRASKKRLHNSPHPHEMQSMACILNERIRKRSHQKCNHFIYTHAIERRLHNLHRSPCMQSTACIFDESKNLCSHQKCNHKIKITTSEKRLHNPLRPPEMQSPACISHDCKTVCRHPICNHPAYGGMLAYLHILTRSAVTRMRRHTIARNARCKHLTWQSYALPPRWWDKSPQSPLKTVAYRLCSCIAATPPKTKPKCKIGYCYFSKSVLAE